MSINRSTNSPAKATASLGRHQLYNITRVQSRTIRPIPDHHNLRHLNRSPSARRSITRMQYLRGHPPPQVNNTLNSILNYILTTCPLHYERLHHRIRQALRSRSRRQTEVITQDLLTISRTAINQQGANIRGLPRHLTTHDRVQRTRTHTLLMLQAQGRPRPHLYSRYGHSLTTRRRPIQTKAHATNQRPTQLPRPPQNSHTSQLSRIVSINQSKYMIPANTNYSPTTSNKRLRQLQGRPHNRSTLLRLLFSRQPHNANLRQHHPKYRVSFRCPIRITSIRTRGTIMHLRTTQFSAPSSANSASVQGRHNILNINPFRSPLSVTLKSQMNSRIQHINGVSPRSPRGVTVHLTRYIGNPVTPINRNSIHRIAKFRTQHQRLNQFRQRKRLSLQSPRTRLLSRRQGHIPSLLFDRY